MNFSIGSLNCNSLNISSTAKSIQKTKLYSVVSLKCDIIFLSDVRISNKNLSSDLNFVKETFRVNPYGNYDFICNSTRNKRGTAILIKHNLNISEISRESDPDENFLLILAQLPEGQRLILGSVYGPNQADREFFRKLTTSLNKLGNFPIILGGDWNCTFCNDPIAGNIDCLNLQNLPNRLHTNLVRDLCEIFSLSDPFRILYPNKLEYTCAPRYNIHNKNPGLIFF